MTQLDSVRRQKTRGDTAVAGKADLAVGRGVRAAAVGPGDGYGLKYDAQQILAQFAQSARDEVELDVLQAELAQVVQETMQPKHLSVWVRPGRLQGGRGQRVARVS